MAHFIFFLLLILKSPLNDTKNDCQKQHTPTLPMRVPTEIEFYNGGNVVLGFPFRLFFCDDLSLDDSTNKLMIRQQKGITSFFMNEQFLFHVDAFEDQTILVGSIPNNDNLAISTFTLAQT